MYNTNNNYNTIQNKVTPWVVVMIQLIILYLI